MLDTSSKKGNCPATYGRLNSQSQHIAIKSSTVFNGLKDDHVFSLEKQWG